MTLFARKALSRLGNVLRQCQKWHLRRTLTFRTRFPGVATFNIVGPEYPADVNGGESNNIEDGTLRRTRAVSAEVGEGPIVGRPSRLPCCRAAFRIPNSEFSEAYIG